MSVQQYSEHLKSLNDLTTKASSRAFDGLVNPQIMAIFEWRNKKNSAIVLALMNLCFVLVCLFNNSVLSLMFLFCQFLTGLGMSLHLVYLATSIDDYRSNLAGDADNHDLFGEGTGGSFGPTNEDRPDAKKDKKSKSISWHNKKELISPDQLIILLIVVYEALLRVKCVYTDLVTIKSWRTTILLVGMLPIAWLFLYYTRVPDSFVVWAVSNLIFVKPLLSEKLQPRP